MKNAFIIFFAPAALAAPAAEQLQKRQGKGGASVCFVWARGSIEPAPMGLQPGPQLQTALKLKFPSMKTFPVMYAAAITTNISVARTDPASIATAQKAFKDAANSGCQSIVAGGYSQGAAVMHNAVKGLDQATKDKIAGVALFGDTRNAQDRGHIQNFPPEKSKVWCNATDGVCTGTLLVGLTHLAYAGEAGAAANWLAQRVTAHQGGGGGSSSGGGAAGGLLSKLGGGEGLAAKLGGGKGGKESKDSGKEAKGKGDLSGLLSKLGGGGGGSGGSGIDLSAILSKLGSGKESGGKEGGKSESKGSGIDFSAILSKLGAGKESGGKEGKSESKGSGIDFSAILSKLGAGKESGGGGGGKSEGKGSGIDLSAILSKLGGGGKSAYASLD